MNPQFIGPYRVSINYSPSIRSNDCHRQGVGLIFYADHYLESSGPVKQLSQDCILTWKFSFILSDKLMKKFNWGEWTNIPCDEIIPEKLLFWHLTISSFTFHGDENDIFWKMKILLILKKEIPCWWLLMSCVIFVCRLSGEPWNWPLANLSPSALYIFQNMTWHTCCFSSWWNWTQKYALSVVACRNY